jgi:small multidrug resistance pump
MYWIYLALAIVAEVFGTTAMKYSDGFTKLIQSVLVAFFYVVSLILFALALKKVEIGTAYAIWSGAGTALIVSVGFFLFGEPMNWMKIISIVLIMLGVIGLHLSAQKGDMYFK